MFMIIFLSYVGFSDAVLNSNYSCDKLYEVAERNILETGNIGLSYTYDFEQGAESGNYDFSSPSNLGIKSLKIGGEFLGGCVGEVIPGGLVAVVIGFDQDYYRSAGAEWELIHLTHLIGSALLVAPLTWGTAKLFGENSSFWKTLVVTLMGSVVTTFLWQGDDSDDYYNNFYYLFITPIGACIGANM